MSSGESDPGQVSRVFDRTRWSVVAGAAAGKHESLLDLCQQYWYPAYAYVRRCGHAAAESNAIVRAFLGLLVAERLEGVDARSCGRFREYLRGELSRYLARGRHRGGESDGGIGLTAPVAAEVMEDRYLGESTENDTPESAFERAFAHDVIGRAFERLAGEARQAGRMDMYQALEPYLAAEPPPGEYERMATLLGTRPLALVIALKRMRQRFRELVNHELAETVSSEEDLAAERQTLSMVLGSEGKHR